MLVKGIEYKINAIIFRGEEIMVAEGFADFQEVNSYILENSSEGEVFEFATSDDSMIRFSMLPAEGGQGHLCECYVGDWSILDGETIDAIVSEHEDFMDLTSMVIEGTSCVLRLYIEDSESKLLLKKDFATVAELEKFIADNPSLDEIVPAPTKDGGWLIPILGIVELVNGVPKRRPEVLPFDDGMGIPWDPEIIFPACRGLLEAYRESCARRDAYCLRLLADHDAKALSEGEDRRTSQMVYQIVRNLVKRGYDVVSARSEGLVGEWGEEGDPAPLALEMEIVFGDDYDFALPVPAGVPYSEAYGKITFAGGFNMNDDEGLLEAVKERALAISDADSFEELGLAILPFSEAAMEEMALEKLLEWSTALPERA